MKDATHFIEQWKGLDAIHQTPIKDISELKYSLNATKQIGSKTIAVWLIKPKQ